MSWHFNIKYLIETENDKMKGMGKFRINGKEMELPLFEKGDRVQAKEHTTTAVEATGTVEGTRVNGLFVDVKWDEER